MAAQQLPSFEPPTISELRRIYATTTDPDVKRVVLELVRLRKVMVDANGHFQTVLKTWHANRNGHLVAMHLLKTLMFAERFRAPE